MAESNNLLCKAKQVLHSNSFSTYTRVVFHKPPYLKGFLMKKIIFYVTSLLLGSSILAADELQKNIVPEGIATVITPMYDKGIDIITYLKENVLPFVQQGAETAWSFTKTGANAAWTGIYYGTTCPVYFAGGAYYAATVPADREETVSTWPQQGDELQIQCADAGNTAGAFATKQRSTNFLVMSTVFLGGLLAHWGINKIHHTQNH